MTEEKIREFLRRYKAGSLDEEETAAAIRKFSFEDMGFAAVDHSREERQGIAEVIYAAGKTKEQTLKIMKSLIAGSDKNIMATRADGETYEFVKKELPQAQYDDEARIIYVERENKILDEENRIAIVTAGTSDLPVAKEAWRTATLLGNAADLFCDCGVAGIHRLFNRLDALQKANAVIVVAGQRGGRPD